MSLYSRAIDDPQVTHAVVTCCSEHGYGVYAWATEFEAYAIARSMSCCRPLIRKVGRDADGCAETPVEARTFISNAFG